VRLILRLRATKNQLYDNNYHYKVQSFVYNLIRNTDFHYLHDSVGQPSSDKTITPFCFSNIFPYGNMRQGAERKIIISSPDRKFMFLILDKIRNLNDPIRFGDLRFHIEDTKIFSVKLTPPAKFNTVTPIIIRIPRTTYQEYNLDLNHPYDYVFWRYSYPLELFLNQMETNLKNKYVKYQNKDPEQKLRFSKLIFKKQISKKLVVRGMVQTIIATFWEFWLDEINDLAKFGLDTGFGERNSLGFGFINAA